MNIHSLFNKEKTHHIGVTDLFYFLVFIIIGTLGRTILVGWNIQPFPNFEIIMIITFLAALFIKPYLAFCVPLISLVISDLLLGNPVFSGSQINKIVLFTYSGFLLIVLLSIFTKHHSQSRLQHIRLRSILLSAGIGIGFTLLYDTWTNIGWWFLMYPHTIETLGAVFLAGIPFMLYHMLSAVFTFTILGLPLIYFATKKQLIKKPYPISTTQKTSLLALTGGIILITLLV